MKILVGDGGSGGGRLGRDIPCELHKDMHA